MSYTRDWDNTLKLDHSKFKSQPGYVRDLMDDLNERLTNILYGMASGETLEGIKKGRFIKIGTGAQTAPAGTGTAAALDVYARVSGTGTTVELYTLDAAGNEIQLTKGGKIPLDVSGRLANNAYLIARNLADNANVNILKVNTANAVELASHPIGPDTNPTAVLQYTPKGYVDKIKPINLAAPGTDCSGTLPVANGGTGITTSLIKTGTYNGTGSSPVTVTHGCGFTPAVILIQSDETDGTGWAHGLWITGKSVIQDSANAGNAPAITVGATTFAISSSTGFNVSGKTYKFTCFAAN